MSETLKNRLEQTAGKIKPPQLRGKGWFNYATKIVQAQAKNAWHPHQTQRRDVD
jgi:hypothetical protein